MEAGTFEPEEAEIIRHYLRRAEVFMNVGANIGYYCCMALQQKVQTLAFEPIALNLKYLYKNVYLNGWENDIEIFPLAIGNQVGLAEIYGGGTGASLVKGWANTPEYYRQSVPISTLDRIIGSRFEGKQCLILVDIEGAERALLEGAATLLTLNPRPVWIVEICIREHMPEGIQVNPHMLSTFELFWSHGYQARTCDKYRRLVEKDEIEAIARTGNDTLRTHNFIFEPVAVE